MKHNAPEFSKAFAPDDPLAKNTHSFVTPGQFGEKSAKTVLLLVPWNIVQRLWSVWEMILPGIDTTDFGPPHQPILEPRTNNNESLATTPLTNKQH
jgi:hypothetical protein